MAKLKWSLTCRRVITDRELNTVSYIDALEELTVSSVPAQLPDIVVGTVWDRDVLDEVILVRMRGLDPAGEELGVIPVSLDAPGKRRHRAHFSVSIHAEITGAYTFVVEQFVDDVWREESRLTVELNVRLEEPTSATPRNQNTDNRAGSRSRTKSGAAIQEKSFKSPSTRRRRTRTTKIDGK
jgi:hypothetical protein